MRSGHQALGWAALGGAWVLGIALGCSMADAFVCADHGECGTPGTCEASGYCSFPDDTCPSGRRYGDHAGAGLAGTCADAPTPSGDGTTAGLPPNGTSGEPDPDGGSRGGLDTTTTTASSDSSGVTPATGSSSTTGLAESTGQPAQRVTRGLLALYMLDGRNGNMVLDQSGRNPPLDLTIEGEGIAWSAEGLVFSGTGIARSNGAATRIITACQATSELSAEAWVTPLVGEMEGPARIITLSQDNVLRNFTLGQGLVKAPTAIFIGRTRTSDLSGDLNGMPQLATLEIASPVLTHLIYTRGTDGVDRLYVDGSLEMEGVRTGDFSNWSPDAEFALGNEITLQRPWQGTLHLAAVYEHALSDDEVAQNFAAGL